jgi:cytochrome bd-type quinol oxidase subunit 1
VSHLSTGSVIFSFVGFVSLYLLMLGAWVAYVVRQVRRGPDPIEMEEPTSHLPTPDEPRPPESKISETLVGSMS